jgi:hypothetical protein
MLCRETVPFKRKVRKKVKECGNKDPIENI